MAGGGIGGSSGDEVSRRVLQIVVEAKNAASADLAAVEADLTTLQGVIGNVGKDLALVGGGMLAAGALIGGGVAALVDVAAHYQTTMIDIQNNTNMTTEATQKMHDSVLALSVETGASLDTLANGYMHIVNVTGNVASAQDILKVATESAVSTGANASEVANTLAQALHEYGLDTSKAATEQERLTEVQANAVHVMGMYHMAAAESNSKVEDFSEKTARATAVAANFGIPLDQVLATLVALNKHGFPDLAEAQTQADAMMTHMIQPAAGVRKELERLTKVTGVDLVQDFSAAGLASKGLSGIYADLQETYKRMGYSQAQAEGETLKLLNAQRGGLGMVVMLGTGTEDYKKTLGDLDNQQLINTVTQESYARTQETLTNQMARFKASLEATAITLGEALQPAIQSILVSILPLVEQLRAWISTHAELVASLMEGAAKFLLVAGSIITVTGLLLMLVAAVNPVVLVLGILAGAVVALAGSWGINWQSISDAATAAQAWIAQAIQNVQVTVEALEQVFNERFGSIQQVIASVSSAIITEFNNITGGLNTLVTNFGTTMQSILDTVNNFIAPIRDALSYLDPNATHSPSLVSQVSSGVQSIIDTYVTLGQITIPLQDSGAAIASYAAMGKEALASLTEATQIQANNMKSSLDMMKQALADAKTDLSNFAKTPLLGTQGFSDQQFALDQQITALKLKIDLAKQAGLATAGTGAADLGALNAAEAPIRLQIAQMGASGGDTTALYAQIKALETAYTLKQKTSGLDTSALDNQLKGLELQKEILTLQETQAQAADKRAIAAAARGPVTEMSAADIIAGIQGAQSNIALLTPAVAAAQSQYALLTQSLKEQNAGMKEITDATTKLTAAHTAAAAAEHAAAAAKAALAAAAKVVTTAITEESKVTSETVAANHEFATESIETQKANADFALSAVEAHKGHKNLAAAAHESGLQHLALATAAHEAGLMHQDLATKAKEIAAGHLDRAKAAQESADKHAILSGAAKDAAASHQELAAGFHAAAVAQGELTKAAAAHKAAGGAGAGAGAHPALPPPIPPPPSSAPWVNYYKDIDAGAHEMSENDKKRFIDQKNRKSEIETILAGLQAAYQTFSDKLTGIMTPLHDGVIKAFDGIKQSAHDNFGEIPTFVNGQMQQIKDWTDNNMPLIRFTTSHILGLIRGDWDQHTRDITTADNKMWADLQANNGKSTTDLEKTLATAWETIKGAAIIAWDVFKKIVADHWDAIKLGVSTTISDIETGLVSVMKAINGDWEGAWAGIELILGNHWGGMVDQVKSSVNTIIGFINSMINAWNGIHFSIPAFDSPLTGHFGGLSVGTDHINTIPLLATGGIVTGPGLFGLGEGGEPEAVVPLSRAASMGFGGDRGAVVNNYVTIKDATVLGSLTQADLDEWAEKLSRILNSKYSLYSRHP